MDLRRTAKSTSRSRDGVGNSEDFNLDVCASYKEVLLIVECKYKRDVDFKEEILAWSKKIDKIRSSVSIIIKNSVNKKIKTGDLAKVKRWKLLFAASRATISPTNLKQAHAADMEIWDADVLSYYEKVTSALTDWTKYEIMHELGAEPKEVNEKAELEAIELGQPGGTSYLFSLDPERLLRISYVYRRSRKETLAYQRVIHEPKIDSVGAYLKRSRALMANNIIIAFDREYASDVKYEGGKLAIPLRYCCARMIDGQHRLYGFLRTSYRNRSNSGKFAIPVVAFKGLDAARQAELFVDINNNQKKMDPSLLGDLSALLGDLTMKETWPSAMAMELNREGPWKSRMRVYEIAGGRKSISLAGFSQFALQQFLLHPRTRKGRLYDYTGPLYKFAPFDWKKKLNSKTNREVMKKHVRLLSDYFSLVRTCVAGRAQDRWENYDRYGITKAVGTNALLMVLCRILETGKSFGELKIGLFLKPIANVRWTKT